MKTESSTLMQNNITNTRMKNSSIEWLQECISIHLTHEQQMQFEGLFQQAKEMHKQEILEAHEEGVEHDYYGEAEEYYKNTYENERD